MVKAYQNGGADTNTAIDIMIANITKQVNDKLDPIKNNPDKTQAYIDIRGILLGIDQFREKIKVQVSGETATSASLNSASYSLDVLRKKVIDMVKTMLSNLEDVIYNMKQNPHLQHRIEGGPFILKKSDTKREQLRYIKHTPKSIPMAPLVVPKYQSRKELSMPFELSDEPVTYLEEPTILEDEDIFKPVTKAKGKSRMKIHEVKATGKIVEGPTAHLRKSSKSKKSEPAPSPSMDIPANLSKLTVVALKDLMRSRGIKPMTGKKADLIARIESHQPKSRPPTPVASPPKKARTPPIKRSSTPKAFQDLQLEEFV